METFEKEQTQKLKFWEKDKEKPADWGTGSNWNEIGNDRWDWKSNEGLSKAEIKRIRKEKKALERQQKQAIIAGKDSFEGFVYHPNFTPGEGFISWKKDQ